jgi:hypothetical protein
MYIVNLSNSFGIAERKYGTHRENYYVCPFGHHSLLTLFTVQYLSLNSNTE